MHQLPDPRLPSWRKAAGGVWCGRETLRLLPRVLPGENPQGRARSLRRHQGHDPLSGAQSPAGYTGAEAGQDPDRGAHSQATGRKGRSDAPPLNQSAGRLILRPQRLPGPTHATHRQRLVFCACLCHSRLGRCSRLSVRSRPGRVALSRLQLGVSAVLPLRCHRRSCRRRDLLRHPGLSQSQLLNDQVRNLGHSHPGHLLAVRIPAGVSLRHRIAMAQRFRPGSRIDSLRVRLRSQYSRGGSIMNAEDLRSVQAPLKERYRETPEAALITLHAQGRIGEDVSCKVETGKALVVAGLHPATGGSGQSACSGDMLLEALVACAGVTLNAVATALGIELRNASLDAEGDLDFRGTLGVSKEVAVGFQNIRLQFTLDTDASEEQLATLLRLTERYCVVYQTLAHRPALTVTRNSVVRAPLA